MLQSELKSALASAVSQLRYTSVIKIAAAVEYDFGDTLCYSSLADELTNELCCFLVSAVALEGLLLRRSGNQGYSRYVVNDLRTDVCI